METLTEQGKILSLEKGTFKTDDNYTQIWENIIQSAKLEGSILC